VLHYLFGKEESNADTIVNCIWVIVIHATVLVKFEPFIISGPGVSVHDEEEPSQEFNNKRVLHLSRACCLPNEISLQIEI